MQYVGHNSIDFILKRDLRYMLDGGMNDGGSPLRYSSYPYGGGYSSSSSSGGGLLILLVLFLIFGGLLNGIVYVLNLMHVLAIPMNLVTMLIMLVIGGVGGIIALFVLLIIFDF
jgi:hypothetical protein